MIDLSPMKGIRVDPARRTVQGEGARMVRSCRRIP